MPVNSSKVIFNSSPLINLAKTNSLYLIKELFGQIIIPLIIIEQGFYISNSLYDILVKRLSD